MDITKLIEANKKMAKGLLEEFKEFFPFAYGMDINTRTTNIATITDDDRPTSLALIQELEKALQFSINQFIAVSFCLDVRILPVGKSEKSDALNIRINCNNGESFDYFIPYEFKNDNIIYGVLEVYKGASFVHF